MPHCPLCGRPAPLRFEKAGYAIHRCAGCDFELAHPTPTPETLSRLYSKGYFTGGGSGYADYFASERPSNERKAVERLARLASLGVGPGARILDVGSADGTFVKAALALGLDAHGVEPSPQALAAIPEALRDRVHGSIDEAAAHGPWNAVTLWDVLEHLPGFLDALRTLRGALASRGVVGVVLPVIDNIINPGNNIIQYLGKYFWRRITGNIC